MFQEGRGGVGDKSSPIRTCFLPVRSPSIGDRSIGLTKNTNKKNKKSCSAVLFKVTQDTPCASTWQRSCKVTLVCAVHWVDTCPAYDTAINTRRCSVYAEAPYLRCSITASYPCSAEQIETLFGLTAITNNLRTTGGRRYFIIWGKYTQRTGSCHQTGEDLWIDTDHIAGYGAFSIPMEEKELCIWLEWMTEPATD